MESWPVWSADGGRVLFLAGAYPAVDLYVRTGGRPEPLIVPTDEYGTPISLRRALGGAAVYALCTRGTTTDLYEVDVDDPEPHFAADPGRPGPRPCASWWVERDPRWLSGSHAPFSARVASGTMAVGARRSGRHGAAPSDQPSWPLALGCHVGRQEVVRWKGHDGLEIEGVLVHPPGAEGAGPLPLVVEIHGGPAGAWTDRWLGNWHDWAQPLAARGMRVLLPNPRGSTGRGNGYATANLGDIGGGDLRDVLAGVDALVQRGLADPERLGIGGWSYGGTLTSLGGDPGRPLPLRRGRRGHHQLDQLLGHHGYPHLWRPALSGPAGRGARALRPRSATFAVRHLTTPTLIVHGEADVRVPLGQGRELYTALRQRGVAHSYVTYPREGHQILERAHQRDLLTRVLDWFTTHLGQGA